MKISTRNSQILSCSPEAHAVAYNGACKCRLPEGPREFRSQGLSCAGSQRYFSDELAYMRNRLLS